jgi:hypothetical protein
VDFTTILGSGLLTILFDSLRHCRAVRHLGSTQNVAAGGLNPF